MPNSPRVKRVLLADLPAPPGRSSEGQSLLQHLALEETAPMTQELWTGARSPAALGAGALAASGASAQAAWGGLEGGAKQPADSLGEVRVARTVPGKDELVHTAGELSGTTAQGTH
jgi:hypothetical protein